MKRGTPGSLLVGVALAFLAAGRLEAAAGNESRGDEKVDGYAEWRAGDCLLADGQRVCPGPGMKFKGQGDAKSFASIPLGYELKAKGARQADGTLLAKQIEAKPNGGALFEGEVRSATDAAEARARQLGHFQEDANDPNSNVGRLVESGPYVDRVRDIVGALLPPYLHPEDLRIYVIENKEWNAFAMGNYSIYVFTGFLDDMDDDEVAMVLGHELVHATHEHSRKEFKRQMWVQLAALGVLAASTQIEDDKKREVVQLATGLAAMAYSNGYGRGMEDQADRVGLRYAYEAGFDITKGPRLWNRFAKKYGNENKVVNFFFSNHSVSEARASKLEKEIAYNYPEGPKPDGPAYLSKSRSASSSPSASGRVSVPVPAGSQALVSGPRPNVPAAASTPARTPVTLSSRPAAPPPPPPASNSVEIEPGMTQQQVLRILGEPKAKVVFKDKTRWTYPDVSVVFEQGKVVDVMF